jgi:hypothetical protein
MARQIGTVLKKVQLRKDLHTVLAKSVIEARAAMGLADRSDSGAATPIAADSLQLGDVEETPRLDRLPTPDEKPRPLLERARGLRHYLPFFGRKRG